MAASFDPTDPRDLTPQQRLDAVAAILAVGTGRVLALRAPPAAAPPETREESAQNQLDVSPETRLHVPRG
jgi:hypothetical protein